MSNGKVVTFNGYATGSASFPSNGSAVTLASLVLNAGTYDIGVYLRTNSGSYTAHLNGTDSTLYGTATFSDSSVGGGDYHGIFVINSDGTTVSLSGTTDNGVSSSGTAALTATLVSA